MAEKRLLAKRLQLADEFTFKYCAVREFAILPVDGREDFGFAITLYGERFEMYNVGFDDGGLNDSIYSCPERVDDSIIIECILGEINIFYKN